ncbi:uncharacterized protein LOC142803990 [Rhipicephalus microplus]|uniref:uncharacterized protein LOC142803990 n=1 Tax=Rhipicephalus microplus TaxID=6941 RepID=UPI003F6B6D3A
MRCFACVFVIVFYNVQSNMSVSQKEKASKLLKSVEAFIDRNDRRAIATCRGQWDTEDKQLLRHVPWPVTLWTLPSKNFLRYLSAHAQYGIRSIVIVPRLGRGVSICLATCLSRIRAFQLVDWIVIQGSDEAKDIFQKYIGAQTTRNFSCDVVGTAYRKKYGNFSHELLNASDVSVYTRECRHKYRDIHSALSEQNHLRNSDIYVGCQRAAENHATCAGSHEMFVFAALRVYNVSLHWTFQPDHKDLLIKLTRGYFDIVGHLWPMYDGYGNVADFSAVLEEQYETFYYQRGKYVLASMLDIVLESSLAFSLLSVAILFAALVLAIADIKEMSLCYSESLTDSVSLLLASFYATPSFVPWRFRWPTSRSILYTTWLMAMLPLSTYIRSELVSRLSWRSPADVVDTLEELELALERRTFNTCLLQGSLTLGYVEENRNDTSFYKKLTLAFESNKYKTSLKKGSSSACLLCARKHGNVCLMHTIPKCVLRDRYPDLMISEDKVQRVLLTFPVRKNFALRGAFRKFVTRIVETSLLRVPVNCSDMVHPNTENSEDNESSQMSELSRFFALYVLFLGSCVLVLLVELMIANQKINFLFKYVGIA